MITAAYGTWPSPIDAAAAVAVPPRIERARFVGDEVWWSQSLPEEGGRSAILRATVFGDIGAGDAGSADVSAVLPAPWSARSRVHEYGGGAWTVDAAGRLFMVERSDGRVWRRDTDGTMAALTAEDPDARLGGLIVSGDGLLAVRERTGDAVRHDIVRIDAEGEVTSMVAGSDFVAQPSLSPDGRRLAWIAWNHPDMPWDRTQLRVGDVVDGRVPEWTVVAGGASAPLQPWWEDDRQLLYTDDADGYWNLHRADLDTPGSAPVPVAPAEADTGGGLWVLDARWFLVMDDGRIAAVRTLGRDRLVVIDRDGHERSIELPDAASISVEDSRGSTLLVTLTGATRPPSLWVVDIDDPERTRQVTGDADGWDESWMPRARPFTVDSARGPVHAFDYPPTSPVAVAPDGERAPYVVLVHGGPTSHVAGAASAKAAYFTSRGIGVLDVNYGGSTGYGRTYRERLLGQWGVVDVDDVVAAARGLAGEGRADPGRMVIEGGSAGGWTVLCAITRTDAFAAGISRFGVGDARALAADTHDFEAHYLDGLIGPWPEAESVYVERSPLTHSERFTRPVLLLQGDEDTVVPPSQAAAIQQALRARGVPHAVRVYRGEGHGFRRRETLIDVFECELAFIAAVCGLDVDGVPPLPLETGSQSGRENGARSAASFSDT